jgi:hypothetical protein
LAKGRNGSCNRLSINTLQRRDLLPIRASCDGDSSFAKIGRPPQFALRKSGRDGCFSSPPKTPRSWVAFYRHFSAAPSAMPLGDGAEVAKQWFPVKKTCAAVAKDRSVIAKEWDSPYYAAAPRPSICTPRPGIFGESPGLSRRCFRVCPAGTGPAARWEVSICRSP